MSKLDATEEDQRDALISRLKHDIEHYERVIGALLDKIETGQAGSRALISKDAYLKPWRRVFFNHLVAPDGIGGAIDVSVWHQRLRPPYRHTDPDSGVEFPSEPLPWEK